MITNTEFSQECIIRMPGTEHVFDIIIIFRTLVCIADKKRDRSSCCLSFKDAGEDLNCVAFLARGRDLALPWFTAIKVFLDINC